MNQPLTFSQLAQIAPLDEKTKAQVLNQEANLSKTQKYEISKLCWDLLSAVFIAKVDQKKEEMLREMAEHGAEYEPEDFQRIEDEIIADLLIKIDGVKTEQQLSGIKSQLKTNIEEKNKKMGK